MHNHVIVLYETQLGQVLKRYMRCGRVTRESTADTVHATHDPVLFQRFIEKVVIKYRAAVWIHPKRVTHR